MQPSKPSIIAVLAALSPEFGGLQDTGGWRAVRCAFHGDKHASASYNPDLEVYVCHTCGISGDAYAVIQQVEGVDFATARERAAAITGQPDEQSGRRHPGGSKLTQRQRNRAGSSGGRRLLRSGGRG